jgi:uncharacterized membrane protein YgaE (UPF0421/DUF939 family)
MPTQESKLTALKAGVRVGLASGICLCISEWFHLEQPALGAYTAYLVMALFPVTSFQKGIERFVGRTLGFVYVLYAAWFCLDAPLLFLVFIAVGQTIAVYIYLSGRLAYAALMGGVFIGVMAALAVTTPNRLADYAGSAVVQLLLGEMAAYSVNFITGTERSLSIQIAGSPLLPLNLSWLNTALMLSFGQVVTLFATLLLELPVTSTMVSTFIIGVAPGTAMAVEKKAWQRTLGALWGGGCALLAIALVELEPYFALFVFLTMVIMIAATYLTTTSTKHAYAFLQMGLVFAMVFIGDKGELGSVGNAVLRLVGIGVALVIATAITLLWPHTLIGTATPKASTVAPQPT